MNYLNLPARLLCIADMVPKGSLTADIGTDHALLPIYLVKKGITASCIAADIVDGPLESAKKNISAAELGSKITTIKSNGLEKVYTFTPKTVIIAGMGGETIRNIISDCDYSKSGAPFFLLQPMTHLETLREYLFNNGFSIVCERVVQEQNRFYVIIATQYTQKQKHYFDFDAADFRAYCELGGIFPTCKSSKNYLIWKRGSLAAALKGIEKSADESSKKGELSAIINEIDRRLK